MFCDSDDVVHPQWCEILYQAIQDYPDSFIACTVTKIMENDPIVPEEVCYQKENVKSITYEEMKRLGCASYSCIKIFRRDIIQNYDIKFPEGVSISEDLRFTVQYIPYCKDILYVPISLYYYIQHSGSLMRSHHNELLRYNLEAFYCQIPLISPENLTGFCDLHLGGFIKDLDWIFSPKDTRSRHEKLKYNSKMLSSEAFQFCLSHCSGKYEHPIIISVLKTKNYHLYRFMQFIRKLKHLWKGNIT